ncbi:MAG: hypothetical protein C4329_12075, partial [Chitinophagaceae bacterium]
INQTIYVNFTPTAVQSYNGNIPVTGGGTTTTTNVAATGAGVNTPPVVTTNSATGITTTGATLGGVISSTGCSTVTAYGIEYSTTSGFTNGSGTQVTSSNLSGTNFSVTVTGLTASTTYYYKAFATNGGGTTYGSQRSFTTLTPPPATLTATTLAAFVSTCVNNTAGPNSFTLTGSNLSSANITVGPLSGYTFAITANGTYTSTLTLTPSNGTINQTIYVNFTPTAVQSYNGNIPITGGGTTSTLNVAASGSGVNSAPTVITGAANNITTNSAILAGSIAANGCSNPTAYGIEYSGVNGFTGGQGTKVFATNLTANNFSATATNLVQGATYYYRAFATNNGGISYGAIQSFTLGAIANTFAASPVPASRGGQFNFSMNNLKPGYYALVFYNSAGQKVYQKDYNIQSNFINEQLTVPASLAPGAYRLMLINTDAAIATKSIIIL